MYLKLLLLFSVLYCIVDTLTCVLPQFFISVVVSPMFFSYYILDTASSPDHVNCKCCLMFSVDIVKRLIVLIVVDLTLVPKPGTGEMASNGSICVPEPLQHEDARSWFKRFELCFTIAPPDTASRPIVGYL